jgi:hypothetical protein
VAEEEAGHSVRFAGILRYFRFFWLVSVAIRLIVAGWLITSELLNPYPGGGWGFIIGPVLAAVIIVAGYVPYAIAQLFLSVRTKHNG